LDLRIVLHTDSEGLFADIRKQHITKLALLAPADGESGIVLQNNTFTAYPENFGQRDQITPVYPEKTYCESSSS